MIGRSYQDSCMSEPKMVEKDRRDAKDDIKTAMDLLFDFNEKLSKLHYEARNVIEKLVQRDRY